MTPGSAVPKAGVAAAQRDRSHSALQRPASSAGSYWPASVRGSALWPAGARDRPRLRVLLVDATAALRLCARLRRGRILDWRHGMRQFKTW